MSAETICRALGGRRVGDYWMAPCPTHEDRNPSLSITDADDGKILVHCHAGCDQSTVIGELRSRGLWECSEDSQRTTRERPTNKCVDFTGPCTIDRTTAALRIWHSAIPAVGTPVETYLQSRGVTIPPSDSLRFNPCLKHPSGSAWPSMIALVIRGMDGKPLAIHRTFLSRDGTGKAPVSPQKMMLGPCRGGAVRLAAATGTLMIGEGIETCMAAMQATGLPAWAALSTSGLRTLELPTEIDELIVLADGDEPGELAASNAAKKWKREGRSVRVARPPAGMDFNDLLLGRRAERGGAV